MGNAISSPPQAGNPPNAGVRPPLTGRLHTAQETTAFLSVAGKSTSNMFGLQHLGLICFAYSYPQRRLHG